MQHSEGKISHSPLHSQNLAVKEFSSLVEYAEDFCENLSAHFPTFLKLKHEHQGDIFCQHVAACFAYVNEKLPECRSRGDYAHKNERSNSQTKAWITRFSALSTQLIMAATAALPCILANDTTALLLHSCKGKSIEIQQAIDRGWKNVFSEAWDPLNFDKEKPSGARGPARNWKEKGFNYKWRRRYTHPSRSRL